MDTNATAAHPDAPAAPTPTVDIAARSRAIPRTSEPPPRPKKRIRLGDLIREGKPIYISFPPRPKEGVMTGAMFQLNHPKHPDVRIKPIPMSRVPIELSNRTPHEHLKDCGDLYTAIDSGHLLLWDPEEAEEWLDKNKSDAADVAKRVHEFMTFERSIDPRFYGGGGADFNIEDLVNQQVMQICLDVREQQITVEDGLVELIQMEPELSENDLEYVYALSGRPALSKWAQEVSAERNKDPNYVKRQEFEWKRRIEARRREAMSEDFQPETTRFDEMRESGQLGHAYRAGRSRVETGHDEGRGGDYAMPHERMDPSVEEAILAGARGRRASAGLNPVYDADPAEPAEPEGL